MAPGSPGPVHGRVLVIDDQPINVRLVKLLLENSGFTVIPAWSGAEGVALAAESRPDVVLLDMRMPGMDGFQVMEHFRADPRLRALPVIFLTADNDRQTLVRAFVAGAIDFVTKPFIAQELVGRVRTHVELSQARDSLQRLSLEQRGGDGFGGPELVGLLSEIRSLAELQLQHSTSSPELARLAQDIRSSADAAIGLLGPAQARDHGDAESPGPGPHYSGS